MTNASLQAAVSEFGDRIVFIILDNARRIRFGFPESPLQHVNQLVYKTFGGEDYFGYSQPSPYPNDRVKGVTYTVWHRTDSIQQIGTMDEGFSEYRVDPYVY